MKKQRSLIYHILVFVLAQIAWFSLLGLWIYWYITNYMFYTKVGQEFSAQIISDGSNVFALVSGLILLVVVAVGMSMIFIYLNRQLHINKLYDNFISNVTHELKSPLSSIQLYLETMSSRDVPQKKQRDFFNLMQKDVNRLNGLINSILYMSGLDKKKTAFKYAHDYHIYNANSVIPELIMDAANRQNIPGPSLRISGDLQCRCVIDRNWFGIVFDNLLNNAKKYSLEELDIKINLSCTSKVIIMEIADKGIGLATKELKKIFHKFHRVDSPASPSVKGTGLGLHWVKEIVKYHGGKVTAFSQGLGTGTTFQIELPVYKVTKKRHIRNLLKQSIRKMDKKNE